MTPANITNIRPPLEMPDLLRPDALAKEIDSTLRCAGIVAHCLSHKTDAQIINCNVSAGDVALGTARVDLLTLTETLDLQIKGMSMFPSILRVACERLRQGMVKRYTREADMALGRGVLVDAAMAYLMVSNSCWPFARNTFKPSTRLRNLEKAAALIMAEIDCLLAIEAAAQNPTAPKDTAHE